MTVQVEYEPVNFMANKQPFERYLSAAPTRMFSRDETISAFGNPYIDSHQILTDRIREFNAKYIRAKSGLRLARVLEFTLKMVKYAPLEGRGWQPLPEFLSKKKAILNIQNNDEPALVVVYFGYFTSVTLLRLLYFGYFTSVTHFFTSLNAIDSQRGIAIKRVFTKNKCFNATISKLVITKSRRTMSICMRISFK